MQTCTKCQIKSFSSAHQVVKDIPLVDMDGDEGLKHCPLHFGQVPGCLVNQCVEQFQETLVGLLHHLAVVLGILERFCGISSPQQLDAQKSNLSMHSAYMYIVLFLVAPKDVFSTYQSKVHGH